MKTALRFATVSLVLVAGALPARGAYFAGRSRDITDFAGGSEVSTRGTLIDAVNLLNDNVDGIGVSTTINGVLFKGTQPGAFFEGAEDFANASFVYHGGDAAAGAFLWNSGGAYETLARSQIYKVDNTESNTGDGYGVVNLVPGQFYQLQVFMLDDREGINKTFPLQFQQVHFTGDFDGFDLTGESDLGYFEGVTIGGNGVTQASGEIARIEFSIDEGFNGIFVNAFGDGAFNGMQLRSITNPGDLDGDSDVDGADFLEWQRGFGSQYDAQDLAGITQFLGGAPVLPSVGAVPEPSTTVLGAAAFGLVTRWVRRCRRRAPKALGPSPLSQDGAFFGD